MTNKQVVNWIKSQNWDDYIKDELIKKANNCPMSALEQFGKEIEIHVVKIRKLKREKDEEKARIKNAKKDVDSGDEKSID